MRTRLCVWGKGYYKRNQRTPVCQIKSLVKVSRLETTEELHPLQAASQQQPFLFREISMKDFNWGSKANL